MSAWDKIGGNSIRREYTWKDVADDLSAEISQIENQIQKLRLLQRSKAERFQKTLEDWADSIFSCAAQSGNLQDANDIAHLRKAEGIESVILEWGDEYVEHLT